MEIYKCIDCGNTMNFVIMKVTNVWRETEDSDYSENVIEVIVCDECKSTHVAIKWNINK